MDFNPSRIKNIANKSHRDETYCCNGFQSVGNNEYKHNVTMDFNPLRIKNIANKSRRDDTYCCNGFQSVGYEAIKIIIIPSGRYIL